jgi:hypothetical protein
LKSYQKNAFSGFCQKFWQAMVEIEKNIFANFLAAVTRERILPRRGIRGG